MTHRDDFGVDEGAEFKLDERFADWVDGRLEPAELAQLQDELDRDSDLRAAAEQYRATVEMLRTELPRDPELEPPGDMVAHVMARLDASPPRKLLPIFGSLLAAAAMISLVFVLWEMTSPADLERGTHLALIESASEDAVPGVKSPRYEPRLSPAVSPSKKTDAGEDRFRRTEDADLADQANRNRAKLEIGGVREQSQSADKRALPDRTAKLSKLRADPNTDPTSEKKARQKTSKNALEEAVETTRRNRDALRSKLTKPDSVNLPKADKSADLERSLQGKDAKRRSGGAGPVTGGVQSAPRGGRKRASQPRPAQKTAGGSRYKAVDKKLEKPGGGAKSSTKLGKFDDSKGKNPSTKTRDLGGGKDRQRTSKSLRELADVYLKDVATLEEVSKLVVKPRSGKESSSKQHREAKRSDAEGYFGQEERKQAEADQAKAGEKAGSEAGKRDERSRRGGRGAPAGGADSQRRSSDRGRVTSVRKIDSAVEAMPVLVLDVQGLQSPTGLGRFGSRLPAKGLAAKLPFLDYLDREESGSNRILALTRDITTLLRLGTTGPTSPGPGRPESAQAGAPIPESSYRRSKTASPDGAGRVPSERAGSADPKRYAWRTGDDVYLVEGDQDQLGTFFRRLREYLTAIPRQDKSQVAGLVPMRVERLASRELLDQGLESRVTLRKFGRAAGQDTLQFMLVMRRSVATPARRR